MVVMVGVRSGGCTGLQQLFDCMPFATRNRNRGMAFLPGFESAVNRNHFSISWIHSHLLGLVLRLTSGSA